MEKLNKKRKNRATVRKNVSEAKAEIQLWMAKTIFYFVLVIVLIGSGVYLATDIVQAVGSTHQVSDSKPSGVFVPLLLQPPTPRPIMEVSLKSTDR